MRAAHPRAPSRGPTLAGLIAGCLALALVVVAGQRLLGQRVRVEALAGTEPVGSSTERADPLVAGGELPGTRVALAESAPAVAEPPATSRLTGRLQVNGYAALRGRVHLSSADGSFERTLVIDDGGRFYCKEVPATPLFAAFEAEGVFDRQLVLPDHYEILPRAGELTVVDLDWWTRHLNLVVHAEDGLPGPARVELRGPGYETEFSVDPSGLQRLELVGEGFFTLRAVTPAGRVGEVELELEAGDDLDTAVLVARIKEH